MGVLRDGSGGGVSRRAVLKAVGAGALMAGVVRGGKGAVPAATAKAVIKAEGRRVVPFGLGEVRILTAPFFAAQERDGRYLLSLSADRMLHGFRKNAGLEPKAPVYGGWESVAMWADIRAHGHTLGHYLSACAMMYAATGEGEFKKRCDYIVAELKECQVAGKTGLVCAFPDGALQIENLVAGRRAVGVPWYTLHKVFAGLRDAYVYTGNAAAREVLVGLTDWAVGVTAGMTDAGFEKMLGVEHGGMNEVLADVYMMTKEPKHLALAERFCHRAVLGPLSQGQDKLDGLHSNTQIPKIVGFQRLYEVTGKAEYLAAATFFWSTVVGTRSFVTGGNGDNEHFFPVKDFGKHLTAKTSETCCSYNMLKLTRALFTFEPSVGYADYYERGLFNNILASQDPDSGMMTYFQPLKPGYLKLYCTPEASFWCCTGTGMENHAKYGEGIYFKETGGGAPAIYVNLFISSRVAWKEMGVVVTQTTAFPENGSVRLEVEAEKPTAFVMKLRRPAWCSAMVVKVNGEAQKAAGQYFELSRTWKAGDVVVAEVSMGLRAEALPGVPEMAAFVYGPIVMAGLLGKAGIKDGADLIVNERTYGAVLNEAVEVPVLVGTAETVAGRMKSGGEALKWVAEGKTGEVVFVPYYRVAHERYSVYWKVTG